MGRLGSFVHNRFLLDPIEAAARSLRFRTAREVVFRDGATVRFGDLLLERCSLRVLVEAEMSPRRVSFDVHKHRLARSSELWIVVPTTRVKRAVTRKLEELRAQQVCPGVFVLLQSQAVRRLTSVSELNSASLPPEEKHK